jgi:predicted metalloprotease with PDZ domain
MSLHHGSGCVHYAFDEESMLVEGWILLKDRVHSTSAHAPLGGIERGGWRLIYNDQPNAFIEAADKIRRSADAFYSLGFLVDKEGKLVDVIPGSPAYAAGVGPAMKLMAINGRKWSKDVLHDALRNSTKSTQPIELLVEDAGFFKTYSIAYHDGIQYPHLVRSNGEDIMSAIVAPRTK